MLIVANWKAYVGTIAKAKRLNAVAKRLAAKSQDEIVLAPSAPHLGYLAVGNRTKVAFAAQDLSAAEEGAATGETVAPLLADLGVSYAVLGHSERRAMGDTDAVILAKVRHALAHGIVPILCIGERERDTEARYLSVLRSELASIFAPLPEKDRKRIVIAYEPIWAIGKTASGPIAPADLSEMILYIRKLLAEYLPGKASAKARILYGGSVEPGNIHSLSMTGIDGFLIGRASTDAASFGALVKAIA